MIDATSSIVRTERSGRRLLISARRYSAVIADVGAGFEKSPYLSVYDESGHRWLGINLLSSVHTAQAADETLALGAPVVDDLGDGVGSGDQGVRIRIPATSSAWRSRVVTVVCTPDTVELSVSVEGHGDLTDVTLLGGDAVFASRAGGTFRSRIDFRSLLVPAPGEPVAFVRTSETPAVLSVVGDADPARQNAIFSPPPLVFGFGREAMGGPDSGSTAVPEGSWLGVSVRAAVADLTFTALRYEPVDGGALLRAHYEGHTRVDGSWSSPTIVLRPADDGLGVIDDYRDDLRAHGFAPGDPEAGPAWWSRPMFCGWGAQCALVVDAARQADPAFSPEDAEGIDPKLSATPAPALDPAADLAAPDLAAPDLSRQDVYDGFLARLHENGVDPGTIVVDDRWQANYGTATVDAEHWPDLRGWIAGQHALGRRVLLWWKAWDPRGLPIDECVTDTSGRAVSADPSSLAYQRRLRAIMQTLLSPEGLDADGFKVDFTQAGPSGRSLSAAPDAVDATWGIAALHRLLESLYSAAKAAKPDALVICHAVHPSFGDVCDMVRLNDMSRRDATGIDVPIVAQMTFRHAIASRALPGHPIDTDQWPMPSKKDWLEYVALQPRLGVPALYYVDTIERTGERLTSAELRLVGRIWNASRAEISA